MTGQKLPILSGRELCKIFTQDGYTITGQKGSHIRLKKELNPEGSKNITIPNHDEIKRTTLKFILKQAGLTKEEFWELLNKK